MKGSAFLFLLAEAAPNGGDQGGAFPASVFWEKEGDVAVGGELLHSLMHYPWETEETERTGQISVPKSQKQS